MGDYDIGNILYFPPYFFTDTKKWKPHYAMVVLPSILMEFENQVLCCVITSNKKVKKSKYCITLLPKVHKCFNKETFCCINRRDIQALADLDAKKEFPLSVLTKNELKKCFNLFKEMDYSPYQDKYLLPVIIREWKKVLS